jgi:hypothetical protein
MERESCKRGWASCGGFAMLVALIVTSAGCAPRPTTLTVPLVLHPTDDYGPTILVGHSLKVFVQPIHDSRSITDRIGENREKPIIVPIYSSGPAPADWLQDSLVNQLRLSGVNVVPDAAGADRQIVITLNQFWAEESPDYRARVLVSVQVLGPNGQVVWSGPADGQDSTVGLSLRPYNYQQVLSNAVVKLVAGLISNGGFAQAISSP